MARRLVGEGTLISVRLPSITSMPTKIRPRALSSGPMRSQISSSRVERSVGRAAPQLGVSVAGRTLAACRALRWMV